MGTIHLRLRSILTFEFASSVCLFARNRPPMLPYLANRVRRPPFRPRYRPPRNLHCRAMYLCLACSTNVVFQRYETVCIGGGSVWWACTERKEPRDSRDDRASQEGGVGSVVASSEIRVERHCKPWWKRRRCVIKLSKFESRAGSDCVSMSPSSLDT